MKTKRIIAALAILLALSGLGAFAQAKGVLTIQCNVSGATVSANGTVIGIASPNLTITLTARTYAIKVAKSGYNDFTQSVDLTSAGLVLQVNLVPKGGVATVAVNVTANVAGADIYVNGAPSGKAPASLQLAPGTYTITVKAPGYTDFVKSVSFSSAIQVNATLNPVPVQQATLSVNSNVGGADVRVNGNLVGKTPLSIQMAPGTYSVQVSAAGFNPFMQNVTLSGGVQLVNATLSPIQASLSVNANVAGADVYLNGNPVGKTPLSIQVAPGNYSVTVKAAGYNDYSQGVTVSGSAQVNATLSPVQATLSVNANVAGADVLINGNAVGKAPMSIQLVPGSYSVTVRAAGFNDFVQTVLVSGNAQVNASLVASSYPVEINSGVLSGAQVYLNGNLIGQTPLKTSLPAGSYSLSVRLAGFSDYNIQLNVSGPQSVSAALASIIATWRINVPANILYKDTGRDQKEAPQGQLLVFIDGNRQKDDSGQVLAGKHVVRVVSGAIMFETTIDFQAGKAYTLEPFVGLNVK